MNARPVIQRELRVASRQGATWWLRLAFATAPLAAFGMFELWPDVTPAGRGIGSLIFATVVLFALSLFVGAFLTADCLSVEKRNGTLGLLFLTPLNAPGIVTGKFACHSLRVFYAWLAMLPCLFLPVLRGGVTGNEVARILAALLVTLLLSLALGVFWSAVCVEARHAVLATLSSMLVITFLPWLPTFLRLTLGGSNDDPDWVAVLSPMTAVITAFEHPFGYAGRAGMPSGAELYWGACSVVGLAAVALMPLSGWLLSRGWRRAAWSPAALKTAPTSPRERRPTRSLPRFDTPADWLAGRGGKETPGLRAFRWVVIVFFTLSLLYSVSERDLLLGFVATVCTAYVLHLVARVQAALTATRTLFEDRRDGALELLLVTPVTEESLLRAHHDSVRRSVEPMRRTVLLMNVALQLAVTLAARQLDIDNEAWFVFTALFTGGFLLTLSDFRTVRWLGAWRALRATTHLRAAGITFVLLMGLPWLGFAITFSLALRVSSAEAVSACLWVWVTACLLYNQALTWGCRRWLRAGLRHRVAETG